MIYEILAIPYPGNSLAMTIQPVKFGYELFTSNHTLGNVNIGHGLAVAPGTGKPM